VSGDLVGTVRLAGKPAFDPETRRLYLADWTTSSETDDERVRNRDRGLHDLVRGVIATRARWGPSLTEIAGRFRNAPRRRSIAPCQRTSN